MVTISVRVKLLLIYSLIIIFTFTIFGYMILDNYRLNEIKDRETLLFQTANIISDTYKRNMEDIIFTRIMVKTYAHQANARILILNENKEVLVDSYNTYIGKRLNNNEVRNSLIGQSTSGVYSLNDSEVIQLAVPININNGVESKVLGSVLISMSLDYLQEDLLNLKKDMFRISLFSLFGAILLTWISATGITKSLRTLTKGVENISSGHLGYEIPGEGKGEIGKLISTFNEMSNKLKNIEINRKYFINSISHELKTPLTSIKALIDSLSLGNNSIDIYKEYLKDIKKETERMENLVNYLMASIKLEDISLNFKNYDIGEIIDETIKFISPYANKNQVKIKSEIEKGIMIKFDKDKFKEVLLNIIDNSVKYRDSNKANSFVNIRMEKSKEKLLIFIEDNGIGINEKELPNIFNQGFRVLDHKKIDGHGIGLALVKNIIFKHNWHIYVESNLGLGTKFTIEIPYI